MIGAAATPEGDRPGLLLPCGVTRSSQPISGPDLP